MAAFARTLGFEGIRVEKAEDLGAAFERAFSSDRPCVLEVLTDPNISMLPPHVKPEQAKAFASAMLHGDPEEGPALVQSVKGVLAEIFPAKEKSER